MSKGGGLLPLFVLHLLAEKPRFGNDIMRNQCAFDFRRCRVSTRDQGTRDLRLRYPDGRRGIQ